MKSLNKKELTFVAAIVFVHLILVCAPYFWVQSQTPQGQLFGGVLGNVEDQNVHLSWVRQASDGEYFFSNLFTTEGTASTGFSSQFTNVLCDLIGIGSRWSHLPITFVYHAWRALFAALALWWFYLLCSRLTVDRKVRVLALSFAAFASGMGWAGALLPQWGEKPFDTPGTFLMPEAFTVTSALFFPLFIVPIALLALLFYAILKSNDEDSLSRRQSIKIVALVAATAFLLTHIHPYDGVTLTLTLSLWSVAGVIARDKNSLNIKKHTWLLLAVAVLAACLASAQQWFALQAPAFRGAAQFMAPPPLPIYLLITYGIFGMLACYGAWKQRSSVGGRLMICWAISCLVCSYLPFSIAGKLIEGSHLPLCFLAAVGLFALLGNAPRRVQKLAAVGVLGIMSVSTVKIIQSVLSETQLPREVRFKQLRPPLYLTSGEQQALRFLDTLPVSRNTGSVLCLPTIGNYLPRFTGRRVFVGHPAYTINFQAKFQQSLAFFEGLAPREEAITWLKENDIAYVWEGPDEKLWAQLKSGTLPSRQLKLHRIFTSENTDIYAVQMP